MYTSFLVCIHDSIINLYVEGLPIGTIQNGKFQVHHLTLPDGTKKPVEINRELLDKIREIIKIAKE